MTISGTLHLVLHLLVPLLVARLAAPKAWRRAFWIMVGTMVVDLDHLLATPIYDPQRCSLDFHPLHSPWACALYLALALFPKTRWVGLGLVLHMILDGIDCLV